MQVGWVLLLLLLLLLLSLALLLMIYCLVEPSREKWWLATSLSTRDGYECVMTWVCKMARQLVYAETGVLCE